MRWVAGAWAAAAAAWMRSASDSVRTTGAASVSVITALRRLMAVASVLLLLCAVINDR